MNILVGLIAGSMVAFASWTGVREVRIYRKALLGEVEYLVSQRRLKRRLAISGLLILESMFLVIGFFFLAPKSPEVELLFWLPALAVVLFLISLTMQDFQETRRDVDRIFREARESARKTIQKQKPS